MPAASYGCNLARGCAVLRTAAARLKRNKVLVRCCIDRDESKRDHVAVGSSTGTADSHGEVSFPTAAPVSGAAGW